MFLAAMPHSQNKDVIICFRISQSEAEKLSAMMTEDRIVGVKSHNQMARKLVVRAIKGAMVDIVPDADIVNPT